MRFSASDHPGGVSNASTKRRSPRHSRGADHEVFSHLITSRRENPMADVSISEAIALFDNSETARGARGRVAKWPLRVVERLRFLHAVEEIQFIAPRTQTKAGIVVGEWEEGPDGLILRLNPSFFNHLPEKER